MPSWRDWLRRMGRKVHIVRKSTVTPSVPDPATGAVASTLGGATLSSSAWYGNQAFTYPTLPQAEVDTTYSLPGGTEWVCTTAAQFTTALANSARGDVITLQAGTTFSGHFTLPSKTGTGWIYIRSSALGSLPAGTRVSLSSVSNMARIQGTSTGGGGVIKVQSGASHWRLAGLEICMPSGAAYTNTRMELSGANYITVDRCVVRGDETYGGGIGAYIGGQHCAIIDSHLAYHAQLSAERQAILAYGYGPYKVQNNYLSSAGECLMFGGGGLPDGNMVSDVTIRGNHFHVPTSWATTASPRYTIKNLLEFKTGQRILVEGNLFENLWGGQGQNGFAILCTVRNQYGDDTWNYVRDVTYRYNELRNCANGWNISGADNEFPSYSTKRIYVHNNLLNLTGISVNGVGTFGTDSIRAFQASGGMPVTSDNSRAQDIIIEHNTTYSPPSADTSGLFMYLVGTIKFISLRVANNVARFGSYGISSDSGGGSGTAAFNYLCDYWEAPNNGFFPKATEAGYPTGSLWQSTRAGVGFVNDTGTPTGNYALSGSSPWKSAASDGTDVGADVAQVAAVIATYWNA